MKVSFTINGNPQSVDVDPHTPLLWVVRGAMMTVRRLSFISSGDKITQGRTLRVSLPIPGSRLTTTIWYWRKS